MGMRKMPSTKNLPRAVMQTESRRHSRAWVKWPVEIHTPPGLVDGVTANLSLSGALIRLSKELNSKHHLPMVLNSKGRLIPCNAQVVWSEERTVSNQSRLLGIGVRFTRMMPHDREFLHREISDRI